MQLPSHDRELAALAAHRATQRTLDEHHRARRLATARQHEEELFAGADRLLTSVGTLWRKIAGAEPHQEPPVALRQRGQEGREGRDAA